MKRNRSNNIGRGVRRAEGTPTNQEEYEADYDRDVSPPPARKMLKHLLVNEVDRAIRDLDQECETFDRAKNHRAASLIPEFDPEGEDCTVSTWLKKIEQLGDIHNWSDVIKSFYLQDKLRGQARKWYNRLDEYNYTWGEWKQMLLRAFPKHRDYSALLDEMMQRKKLSSETMTKYYQDKVAMCFRCKLSDSASVSCIIRGLPPSLQANARAFQCERPDELYEAFLCALDDYRGSTSEVRVPRNELKQLLPLEKKINPDIDPCPRCKKFAIILSLVLVLEISAAIAAYTLRAQVSDMLDTKLRETLPSYYSNPEVTDGFDFIQSRLNCCGVDSYLDWGEVPTDKTGISVANITVPFSCCAQTHYQVIGDVELDECVKLYANGCLPRITYLIYQSAGLLGAGAMTIAFIQVIGIVFSFSLASSIRKAKSERERRRWEIQERMINAYTSLNPDKEKNQPIVYVPFQGQTA